MEKSVKFIEKVKQDNLSNKFNLRDNMNGVVLLQMLEKKKLTKDDLENIGQIVEFKRQINEEVDNITKHIKHVVKDMKTMKREVISNKQKKINKNEIILSKKNDTITAGLCLDGGTYNMQEILPEFDNNEAVLQSIKILQPRFARIVNTRTLESIEFENDGKANSGKSKAKAKEIAGLIVEKIKEETAKMEEETAKVEIVKVEIAKVENAKVEIVKVETAKAETAKVETAKAETPEASYAENVFMETVRANNILFTEVVDSHNCDLYTPSEPSTFTLYNPIYRVSGEIRVYFPNEKKYYENENLKLDLIVQGNPDEMASALYATNHITDLKLFLSGNTLKPENLLQMLKLCTTTNDFDVIYGNILKIPCGIINNVDSKILSFSDIFLYLIDTNRKKKFHKYITAIIKLIKNKKMPIITNKSKKIIRHNKILSDLFNQQYQGPKQFKYSNSCFKKHCYCSVSIEG
jgi:hypothetical protein